MFDDRQVKTKDDYLADLSYALKKHFQWRPYEGNHFLDVKLAALLKQLQEKKVDRETFTELFADIAIAIEEVNPEIYETIKQAPANSHLEVRYQESPVLYCMNQMLDLYIETNINQLHEENEYPLEHIRRGFFLEEEKFTHVEIGGEPTGQGTTDVEDLNVQARSVGREGRV